MLFVFLFCFAVLLSRPQHVVAVRCGKEMSAFNMHSFEGSGLTEGRTCLGELAAEAFMPACPTAQGIGAHLPRSRPTNPLKQWYLVGSFIDSSMDLEDPFSARDFLCRLKLWVETKVLNIGFVIGCRDVKPINHQLIQAPKMEVMYLIKLF